MAVDGLVRMICGMDGDFALLQTGFGGDIQMLEVIFYGPLRDGLSRFNELNRISNEFKKKVELKGDLINIGLGRELGKYHDENFNPERSAAIQFRVV